MKYLLPCLFFVFALACNSKKEPATPKEPAEPKVGGPCTYKHDTIPATVIKIVKQYDDFYDVLLEAGKDTLYYSSEFSGYLRQPEIKEKGLEMGAQFQYVISNITSGHCSPHLKSLKTAKYTGSEKVVK